MLLRFGKLICLAALIPPVVPQASASNLPQTLQTIIPTCAQSCLSDQISRDFPLSICSDSNDLDCLCSHYGLDGYTLGERAFGCLFASDCSTEARANATSVYTICNGENNAVAPTQKTVVVTPSSSLPTARSSASAGGTVPTNTMASSSPSAAPTGSSSAATQATMDSTPTNGPTMSNKSSIPLTEAQVAGIAIASIALVVLTVGIAGCILFVRRRNKRLEQEELKLFSHHSRNASGSGSQLGNTPKGPRGGAAIVGINSLQQPSTAGGFTPPQAQERSWPRYYPIMPGDEHGIGIAQTTNMPQPVPPVHSTPYQRAPQPQYDIPPTETPLKHQHQSWPAPEAERQVTGQILNPTTPPQPLIPCPPGATAAKQSRISLQSMTPRATTQASRASQSTLVSPLRPTPPRPPRSDVETASTRRGRQSVDRSTVVSQLTEFEEDTASQPGIMSPGEPHLSQPDQLGEPSRSNSDLSNDYANNVMPMPKQRPLNARILRPHTLRIQIPSYPKGTSSSVRESEQPSKRQPQPQPQPQGQQTQKVTGSPHNKSPQRSAMASQNRVSPKARKKPSFTIAQISPSDSPLKHPSPKSDPSSTLRSSGVFPTKIHEIQPKQERRNKSRPKINKSQTAQTEQVRDSFTSYTSFESLGSDDDPTPPQEERQLSAVSERSPISGLKYPKIPRPSSQLVARTPPSPKKRQNPNEIGSPKQVTPTPSPKQKDTPATHGIENQLWRTEAGAAGNPSPVRQATPPRQTAQSATSKIQGADVSPTAYFQPHTPQYGQPHTWSWASGQDAMLAKFNPASPFGPMPKLTPTRQGDDLYLKVG